LTPCRYIILPGSVALSRIVVDSVQINLKTAVEMEDSIQLLENQAVLGHPPFTPQVRANPTAPQLDF
jgi:hypothetical protein